MAAFAYLNHGEWLANCSFCGAPWAAKGIRLFCRLCLGGTERRSELIFWPSDKKRDELRRIMRVRPVYARNWKQGELIADLLAENIAHGVETL